MANDMENELRDIAEEIDNEKENPIIEDLIKTLLKAVNNEKQTLSDSDRVRKITNVLEEHPTQDEI